MGTFTALSPEIAIPGQALQDQAAREGLFPRITSTRRSLMKQAALYRAFLAGHSPYPAAPPGRSAHNWGWAFDMLVTPYEALGDVGALWESWGGTWGVGRDPIHFELPGASDWLRSASTYDLVQLAFENGISNAESFFASVGTYAPF